MENQFRYFHVERAPGVLSVHITEPQLNGISTADIIRTELQTLVREEHPAKVVIDMTPVKMLGSAIISSILAVRNRLVQQGGQLVLCNVPMPIRDIYRTLNLEGTLLPVYDSLDDALAATPPSPQIPREQLED